MYASIFAKTESTEIRTKRKGGKSASIRGLKISYEGPNRGKENSN
jgi:hypothetical protein